MTTATPEQQKEFDAVDAELDKELSKSGMHPIVKPVLYLLQNDDAQWWPQGAPLERVVKIRELIDAAQQEKTVMKAIKDLLDVAAVIGRRPGGTMAGGHLLRLCEAVIREKNLVALSKKDGEFASGVLEKAKETVGLKPTAQPAKVGDKAPQGSLRVDQITPGGKRRL